MSENSSKRSGLGFVLLAVFLIGLVIALIVFLKYRKDSKKKMSQETQKDSPNIIEYTPEEFLNEVISIVNNEAFARVLTAQAMHETGVFTDYKFTQYNNAFGMKFPEQRQTTASGKTPTGYAAYDSIQDSIKDILLWLSAKGIEPTEIVPDYCRAIREKGYYTASLVTYNSAVKKHYNAIGND